MHIEIDISIFLMQLVRLLYQQIISVLCDFHQYLYESDFSIKEFGWIKNPFQLSLSFSPHAVSDSLKSDTMEGN